MKRTFIKKSIFTILAAILSVANSFGQTAITTGALSPTEVCAGGNITVPFTTTGTIAPLTNFIAQLSDAAGAFTTPVNIGSAEASPITATIPVGTVAGAAYKVRVISVLAAVTIATGSESAALKVNAIPAAPTVTSPVAYEVGATPVALAASGTGLKWYNAGTGGTGSTTIPVPDTKTEGTRNFFVSQTVSGCESARSEIVVNVTKTACTPPAKPVVKSPVSYTKDQAAIALEATALTGAKLNWYGTDATGGKASATAPTPPTNAVGNLTYYVSQTLNDCESERSAIIVNVTACTPPTKPAVTNKSYEVGDDAPVLTAVGTDLKWYTAASGGTALNAAPKPATATPGTTSYYVSQTNASGCESERAEIVVTITNCTPPAKPTVSNKTYEVGEDAPVLTAVGTNLKWYTAASGGTALNAAPKPATITPGKTSYYVSQTNANGCESERAEIVVTITNCTPPAKPTVSNKTYELGEDAPVLNAVGTNLKWYTAASGGTALNAAPKPATTTPGKTSFYVSQTNASGCESERAEIVVTITNCTPPAKPVVSNKTYELGENAPALTAAGTNLKWYTAASGGTASNTAPKPATTIPGTTSYYVSQTNANGCESERAEIVVTVNCKKFAGPTVTTPLVICQAPTAAAPLKATALANHTLLWYTAATGGTGSTSAPTPPNTEARSYSYFVSQRNEITNCESERVEIIVNVREAAKPTVTTPIEYCVGETAKALTPSGSTFKWYSASNDVTGNTTPPTPKTETPSTTTFYVTQSTTYGSLVCESSRAEVNVIVNARPAALPTVSEAFCQERADKTYTFAAQPAAGNTVNWYTVATGGTASKTAPSVNLKNAGETTFYATQISKTCESATRVVQKIRVKPLPGLPGVEKPLVEICQFVAAQPLSATPVTGGILKWYGTNASGGDPSDNAPIPSTAEGGTTSYFVGQALEGCIGDRAKIDVKINTTPKPQTTTQLAYCQNEVAPRLDATGSILKWYRNANDTEFQGIPFTPFTEKVQDYSFFVTQTGTNGCESPKEEIRIHIKALPSATISGNSTIDLGQTATIRIRFTGDGPWIYALSDGTTDTTDQQNHEIQVKPTTTTSYLLTNVANACGKGLPIGSALVTVKVPTINSGNPSVAEACAGKTFSVPFQQSGDFPAENTFKVQIATENTDAKFVSIPSVASSNIITATFPDTTLAGSYYVRVVSSGTNPNFTVKGSVSSITITASPLPVATITGTQTILVGDKADMKIATTGKAPWTFTLSNGTKDSLITAAVTPYTFKLAPKTTTTYTITKVTNVCGTGKGAGTARVQVDPILGVEPPASADWVNVYPTLVTSQCTVELKGAISLKEASAEVIDLTGRSRAVKTISQKTTEVDFSSYPSGLYLLRVTNGNKNTVWRIMKP
ncbi:T9SS type A sorting domain-containing protein [Dyadobacter sp. LJ53]|uniref:T9SS type A sorting domain-containing protein n=1 Tax=Dyadobacter chenwenxiniae TaxID=2906456 RepID=UPI001F1C345B|nr:T9SS type A sorting domain-containing protein [Dyadobacter chenwenxiniae]MCF0049259.1 T9SS type A sorting domain-containing protein [Dyadobacter chenwenxiniae]